MRVPVEASPTNWVAVRALVDRLTGEGWGGAESPGAVTEQCDCCDVPVEAWRHAPYRQISRRSTQRIAADNDAGVRAACRHRLHVGPNVVGAGGNSYVGGP